jgi:hypothetical protein
MKANPVTISFEATETHRRAVAEIARAQRVSSAMVLRCLIAYALENSKTIETYVAQLRKGGIR